MNNTVIISRSIIKLKLILLTSRKLKLNKKKFFRILFLITRFKIIYKLTKLCILLKKKLNYFLPSSKIFQDIQATDRLKRSKLQKYLSSSSKIRENRSPPLPPPKCAKSCSPHISPVTSRKKERRAKHRSTKFVHSCIFDLNKSARTVEKARRSSFPRCSPRYYVETLSQW